MKLEAEELGILANFSCTVNNHAEARRVAARLDPNYTGPGGSVCYTLEDSSLLD